MRKEKSVLVRLEKPGFYSIEIQSKREFSGRCIPFDLAGTLGLIASRSLKGHPAKATLVGIAALSALYWPLGSMTGDAYKQSPGKIHVQLAKSEQPGTENP